MIGLSTQFMSGDNYIFRIGYCCLCSVFMIECLMDGYNQVLLCGFSYLGFDCHDCASVYYSNGRHRLCFRDCFDRSCPFCILLYMNDYVAEPAPIYRFCLTETSNMEILAQFKNIVTHQCRSFVNSRSLMRHYDSE